MLRNTLKRINPPARSAFRCKGKVEETGTMGCGRGSPAIRLDPPPHLNLSEDAHTDLPSSDYKPSQSENESSPSFSVLVLFRLGHLPLILVDLSLFFLCLHSIANIVITLNYNCIAPALSYQKAVVLLQFHK